MLARVEFTIPGRPVPWARTGFGAGARADGRQVRFTPAKQRAAMVTVQKAYKAAAVGRNTDLLTGALKLEVLCVYGIPVSWSQRMKQAAGHGLVWKTSTPDTDNLGKLIADALNKVAYADDAMIAVSTVAKRYGEPERTVIRLTELEPWEAALDAVGLPGTQARLPV